MSGFVDAFGRPLQKTEYESFSKRGLMLPATALFGGVQDNYMENFNPFVVASDEGMISDPNAEYASQYSNLNDRFTHKNPIAQLNTPRDTQGLMTLSMTHAQDNYIVSRAIRIKRNFALREMQFLGKATTVDFYTTECVRLRLRKILSHLLRYYWTTGRVCVYFGETRPIQRLTILDPRSIIVRRVLGADKVFLLADPRWKTILNQANESTDKKLTADFLRKNLPKYWIKYINDNQPIPLKEESYALIENDLEIFSLRGIDAPSNLPLQPIFQNLAVMEMMMAGDFSVAWMLKHMIALVSIGDPKAEGANYLPPDTNALKKLENTFQGNGYSMWAYVDPTVDVRWIAPNPNLFGDAKFKYHVQAVEWCMGVPSVFTRSDGTFASSSLSMKPFREELTYARMDIQEQLFAKLFPAMREGFTQRKSGNKDPEVSFDTDCLKDDRVIMDELTGFYDRGGLSVRSLLEGKAQSFDTEVQRKLEELKLMKKDDGIFEPAYDSAHGIPDEGGRPGKNGGKPEAATGSQQPRPSRGT